MSRERQTDRETENDRERQGVTETEIDREGQRKRE